MSGIEEIKRKLATYKSKFYQRQLLAGSLLFLSINFLVFFLFSSLEVGFWLSKTGRAILFFFSILIFVGSLYHLIIRVVLKILKVRSGLTDEEAAQAISAHFPGIKDRLINALQLSSLPSDDLLEAAIDKKTLELAPFSFTQAIDYQIVKRYAGMLLLLFVTFSLVSFVSPVMLTEGTSRILNFNREFEQKAPFQFQIRNSELKSFRGEDFVLEVLVEGQRLPQSVTLLMNEGQYTKRINLQANAFSYLFPKMQSNQTVQFEAAGFLSRKYEIDVFDRPDLISMNIQIQEPNYTGGNRRTVENTGNIVVLEGSTVTWQLKTLATDSARFAIADRKLRTDQVTSNQFFLSDRIYKPGIYDITLFNEYGTNRSKLNYSIDVIKDEFPTIITEFFPDSVTYSSLAMGGSISDDYGFTSLQINYKKNDQNTFQRIPITINSTLQTQGFYANWNLDTLGLKPGENLMVYLSVRDNDAIRGPKESKSQTFILQPPTRKEAEQLSADSEKNIENSLDESEKRARNIAERLKKIEDRLKAEQKFNWQERKMLNDVLKEREKLTQEIAELQKEHEKLQRSNQQFQQQSEQVQEKNQKLQEILEQLLDDETRELYEKLKELLEKSASPEELSNQTEELRRKEETLERDLERATELFKRLKMESALEQSLQQLDSLQQKQEQAAQLEKEESEKLQKQINKEFNEFREKTDEIENMNQELKKPEPLQDFELEEKQIAKDQREALEELQKEAKEKATAPAEKENGQEEKKKPASKNAAQQKQQQASQKMKDLSKKLNKMQGGMQMEMMQANLDDLRDILDNLIKLSFNQEEMMREMREVNQSDPRFLELSQDQLKLKDDAKVIQDSLLSLAEKVVQISSFVTREVGEVNSSINESLEFLRERNRNRAITSQQFAMTSMNNLALLLDETMQNMQMAMANASGQGSQKDQSSSNLPDLQEMQNALGEKINKLKGSGKSGRELSEELARLAAEQELIRRQMGRLKEAQDGKPGGNSGTGEMKRAIEMMEQNEIDLVNKRLTQQLVKRQQQIQTRMLEAEKAQRNQEMEEEREAKTAGIISKEMPPGFEEYLKIKKKEIELLKTIPLELNPFYKKEVNDYFRRLSTQEE